MGETRREFVAVDERVPHFRTFLMKRSFSIRFVIPRITNCTFVSTFRIFIIFFLFHISTSFSYSFSFLHFFFYSTSFPLLLLRLPYPLLFLLFSFHLLLFFHFFSFSFSTLLERTNINRKLFNSRFPASQMKTRSAISPLPQQEREKKLDLKNKNHRNKKELKIAN